MTYAGTVINGTIVLDGTEKLPEGARVEVALAAEKRRPASALGAMLLRHAGKAAGLPKDLSARHDHYLYGTPKR